MYSALPTKLMRRGTVIIKNAESRNDTWLGQRIAPPRGGKRCNPSTCTFQSMQDAVALTDTMIGSVRAAGAPAVANGKQLSADLVDALSPVKQTFEGAVTKAQQLPTGDPEAFSQAATELGNEITNSQGSFTASFDALQRKYNDPNLNNAFKTVPACAKLGG